MPHRTSRRRFLRDSAFAAVVLSPAAGVLRPLQRAQFRTDESVIVVGAGPAGLAAAHRLKESGLKVTVLEARADAGGRVRTIRGPFDNGLHGEAGAARISEAHAFTLDWINRLGLAIMPFAATTGTALSVIDGNRFRTTDIERLRTIKLDLHPDERGLTPSMLLKRYIGDALSDLSEPDPNSTGYARWKSYDTRTWPEWLRDRGASEGAVALMTLGADPARLSALYILRQIALHNGARHYYAIRGGMDRLPKAIAAGLGDAVKYNVAVVGIKQGPDKIEVRCLDRQRSVSISADRIVLAVPFSTLRRIDIDPPFNADKMQAIEGLPYYPATRFLFQTRERFWIKAGSNGAARTDYALETWDDGTDQPGGGGMLSATVGGRMDETLAAIAPNDRLRLGEKMVSLPFPEIAEMTSKGFVQRWSDDPWARGAFAAFAPGQMTGWMPAIARPEGRIHFAGEHTSPWTGWMEGALRSAERVVEEILMR